mmetsp:Transcript_10864/g.33306  ORF Transcript_10864/g.33306 Transcript_10864/m.33306 type:complete len:443 (+) Transcript_10864:164-1492(+)
MGVWRCLVVLVPACMLVLCTEALDDERKALMGDLEETRSKTESVLHEKEYTRGSDAPPAETLLRDIKFELERQGRAVDVDEESLKSLKNDYQHVSNKLKVGIANIASKNESLIKMRNTIDSEWKQIDQLETGLSKLKSDRQEMRKSKDELKKSMSALQTKIEKAKEQITDLSDVRLNRWLRERIDEIGDYLQSPDTSVALNGILNDTQDLLSKSASGLKQLASDIDSSTHSFVLSNMATTLIIVLPVLLISAIMSRITRFVNLRGFIFIANAALLCYFVVCFALTLMHIDLQHLHRSSHKQLLLIFVLVATLGPLVTMMTFVAGATSSTKREQICFGIEFVVLLVINGVVAEMQSSSRSLLMQPRSTLSISLMWYAAMSAIMMGTLLLTLFATPRDSSALPTSRLATEANGSRPAASGVPSSSQTSAPLLPTTATPSQDKTD